MYIKKLHFLERSISVNTKSRQVLSPLAILISDIFENSFRELVSKALRIVDQWGTENSLFVNPTKTKVVFFFNRKREPRMTPIIMYGRFSELVSKVKCMAVILDKKHTWKDHFEYACKKALGILFECRKVFTNICIYCHKIKILAVRLSVIYIKLNVYNCLYFCLNTTKLYVSVAESIGSLSCQVSRQVD